MRAPISALTFREFRYTADVRRPMSRLDAFMYNFLTMGVIFPWVFVLGPGPFPGVDIGQATVLAFLVQLPIALAYCFLATALPVSGGDYVYQTRAFGRLGFISVMSGFVLWIFVWLPIAGWLFATLGLAPLLLVLGTQFGTPGLINAALFLEGNWGICLTSLFMGVAALLVLRRGLSLYVRIQRFLFSATLVSVIAVIVVFNSHKGRFLGEIDVFVDQLVHAINSTTGSTQRLEHLTPHFTHQISEIAAPLGLSAGLHSWLPTLAVVTLIWTSLQWSSYSVEQNTEIDKADRFGSQLFMIVGSLVLASSVLLFLAKAERVTLTAPHENVGKTSEFMRESSSIYLANDSVQPVGPATAEMRIFIQEIFQPFPSVLAMAVTKQTWLQIIIALGFMANSFQVTCNCFIGVTRILLAMDADGALPGVLKIVGDGSGQEASYRANCLYFLLSIPVIVFYSFVESTRDGATIAVTLACGYVMVLTSLSAAWLPSNRMRSFWLTSDIYKVPAAFIVFIGVLGTLAGSVMVVTYFLIPPSGSDPSWVSGRWILLGCVLFVIGLSSVLLRFARTRSNLKERLAVVPTEIPSYSTEKRRHNLESID